MIIFCRCLCITMCLLANHSASNSIFSPKHAMTSPVFLFFLCTHVSVGFMCTSVVCCLLYFVMTCVSRVLCILPSLGTLSVFLFCRYLGDPSEERERLCSSVGPCGCRVCVVLFLDGMKVLCSVLFGQNITASPVLFLLRVVAVVSPLDHAMILSLYFVFDVNEMMFLCFSFLILLFFNSVLCLARFHYLLLTPPIHDGKCKPLYE